MQQDPLCIAVVGPTASGKSDLALDLAARHGGEIVNFDSVQVYKGFDIGTAKTPPDERRGIPHHLLDHVEPGKGYSAGDFARDGRKILGQIASRGTMPILVGGTGFYLGALIDGLSPVTGRIPELRDRLQRRSQERPPGYLWRILHRLDSEAAGSVHRNDTPKLIRAIEVSLAGSRPMTEQWRVRGESLRGFRVLTLGLDPPREHLYRRIEDRTRRMFAAGLVKEVKGLLHQSVPRDARPFGALGYAQCMQHLEGACTLSEAIDSTVLQTRRYAKRQLTWFRNRTRDALWLGAFGDSAEAREWAEGAVASALRGEARRVSEPDAG